MFAVLVTLAAIRLSGEPWSTFGIRKPSSLDIFTASLVCVVDFFVSTLGNSVFRDILTSIYGAPYVYRLSQADIHVYHAHGWLGLVALFTRATVVGFSEELVARGYLIPRLERLLHSTLAAILVSAALFGLFHWQNGIFSVCNAILVGLVYGFAFAWTRRLWPLVIAHAVVDFSVFLNHAR
jgi:membrane protease YdiL (CAAX protease family)